MISVANGPYGYYRQGVGWRMLLNGIQFKTFGTGRITSAPASRPAPSSTRSTATPPPSIQAFCVPIVYLDRDLSKVFDDTYGVTITTVLVKPKSRGYVELRSANPDDMPLVSPHLLKDPDDMADHGRRPALLPRGAAHRPARQARRKGDRPRRPRPQRRGDGRPLPPLRQDQLPPGQHRPHGCRRRPHGRARRAPAGARHRQPPRRRHVGGPEHQRRQHQRAGDDARRPLRRLHPRPRPAPRGARPANSREPTHDPRPLPPRRKDRPRHRRHPRHRPRHRHRAFAEAGAHVIMSSRQPKPDVVQGLKDARLQDRLPAGRRARARRRCRSSSPTPPPSPAASTSW